jgi:hypothetical protein
MPRRLDGLVLALAGFLAMPMMLHAQDDAREVAELRRRIAIIRSQMPAITEAAEYAAGHFKADSAKRILVPKSIDPGLGLEFIYRAGGPPESGNADDATLRGVVLLPVRHWDGLGLGIAMLAQKFQEQGRPVITIGSAADRPGIPVGRRFLDNGAPSGDRALGGLNGIANMIVAWTWYAEVVAAATRDGWWTGSYLTVLQPGATQHNAAVQFRMPTPPPTVVAAGTLGTAYLDAVDALLATTSVASHRASVTRAADSLRARRKDGGRLFVATCGHYLQESIQSDTIASPFRPLDWRWDVAGKLRAAGASPGDGMLWFGYGGYDCPNVEVAAAFRSAGLRVVVVTDRTTTDALPGVAFDVPLAWRMPDAGAPLPFPPGAVAPTASVAMAVHYLWLNRLVGEQK